MRRAPAQAAERRVDTPTRTHVGDENAVFLAGRRINDRMGAHVAETLVKLMLKSGIGVYHSRILVLGLAFKENCPDLRNTRVIDIIQALRDDTIAVDCDDPWIDRAKAKHEYGLDCLPEAPAEGTDNAVILAGAHRDVIETGATGPLSVTAAAARAITEHQDQGTTGCGPCLTTSNTVIAQRNKKITSRTDR